MELTLANPLTPLVHQPGSPYTGGNRPSRTACQCSLYSQTDKLKDLCSNTELEQNENKGPAADLHDLSVLALRMVDTDVGHTKSQGIC